MTLRLMTYNILDGGIGREAYLLKVIQRTQPDVLVLQEVFSEGILKFLAASLEMQYFVGEGNKERKVALLSKLPVRSFSSHHSFPPIWRNFIDAEIEWMPNQYLRIIGVHPMAILGVAFELWRLWEARYILAYVEKLHIDHVLIAGDFNAIAPGEQTRTEFMPNWLKQMIYLQGNRVYHFSIQKYLSAGLIDCFRVCNPNDEGFTLPPDHPNARLDYVFVNENMKPYLKSAMVVREPEEVRYASDHLPVVVDFFI
jgi:exodeoxyribonuclease-3